MLIQASDAAGAAPNHPLAPRMAVIASLSHNFVIGCLFGSFSVLMASVEQRLGVSRELSAMGISAVTVCNGVLAPFIGAFAARYSLRSLFLIGAILSALGYALLATTQSFTLFLVAYGLLLGPGMALSGVVLPSTLVTRWFTANRGKVLGLVHVPIVVAIVPLASSALLTRFGAPTTYAVFGVLIAAILIPAALMIVEHPPGTSQSSASAHAAARSATVPQILSSPRFWSFAACAAIIAAGIVVINTHMIPMAQEWGIAPSAGALLASVCALAGIPGSILWGWIADRIGGGPALSVAALGCAILWALLLIDPSYPIALVLIGLLGMHGTASIPLLGTALSETFGPASFSRAFGLSTATMLPFTVIGIQAASTIFVRTGTYLSVIIVMIVAFLLVAPLPYFARARRAPAIATP